MNPIGRQFMKWLAFHCLGLALLSCAGPAGPQGPAGTNGTTSGSAKWVLIGNASNGPSVWARIQGASGNYLLATPTVGITRSSDNGATWTPSGFPDTLRSPVLAVGDSKIVAGSYSLSSPSTAYGIYVSSDSGATWTSTAFRESSTDLISIAVSGANIFAGTGAGITRSTDNGATWTSVGFSGSAPIRALAVSGTNLLAGAYDGMYVSSDNGTTWTRKGFKEGAVVGPIFASGAIVLAASEDGVHRSSDSGTTWTRILVGNAYSLALGGDRIFVGMSAGKPDTTGGVLYSTDNGATWTQAGEGLNGLRCGSVIAHNGYLLATDDYGNVWRLPLSAL